MSEEKGRLFEKEQIKEKKRAFAKKAFRIFTIGSVLSSLGVALETSADALIVGNAYGEYGLAVTGLIMPVYMLYNLLSISIGAGGAAAVSKHFGSEDKKSAQAVFSSCLSFALVAGIIMSLMGLFFAPAITRLLGGAELGEGCLSYIKWILISAPLFIVTPVLGLMLRSDADPKLAASGIAVSVIVNLLLDLFFVTWLKTGVQGAAIAMVIGQLCGLLVYCLHFRKKDAALRLEGFKFKLSGSVSLFTGGVGTASYYAWLFLMLLFFNRLLLDKCGTEGIAVFNIVFNVSSFSYAIFDGISMALPVLIGTYQGERDDESIAVTINDAWKSAALAALALSLALLVFSQSIVRLFGLSGGNILESGSRALRLYAPAVLPACLLAVMNIYYQTLGYAKQAFLISMLRGLLIPVAAAVPAVALLGAEGTSLAMSISEIFALAALFCFAKREKRKGEFEDLFLLKKKGGDEAINANVYESCMEGDFTTLPQIMSGVEEFCDKNEIDPRSAYSIQLSIEELCVNIIRFGFKEDKNHSIYIKLAKYDGEIFLRIRDDARDYNPFEDEGEDGDGMDYIGVELIKSRAKSFIYQRRLVFNNLLIIL